MFGTRDTHMRFEVGRAVQVTFSELWQLVKVLNGYVVDVALWVKNFGIRVKIITDYYTVSLSTVKRIS